MKEYILRKPAGLRRFNTRCVHRDHMYDVVEREYIAEKKAAAKEFEDKKVELRENLLADFEEKRRVIDSERSSMELNGESMEVGLMQQLKIKACTLPLFWC